MPNTPVAINIDIVKFSVGFNSSLHVCSLRLSSSI